MFYSFMTLEKRTYPFVICFIEQLVPGNNKKTVEQEINMLFHEMKKKQRQCHLLRGKMKRVVLVWSFLLILAYSFTGCEASGQSS